MRIAVLHLLLVLPLVFIAQIALGQVYIPPQGNDAHKGTGASPVLTLQRALELSRTAGGQRIVPCGGTYRLTEPLHLRPADSGTNDRDLIFIAASGEYPILSGAVRIVNWRETDPAQPIWSASVPAAIRNSRQFYIDVPRATRARGRLPVALTETATGYTADANTMAAWKNPGDIEFVYTGGNGLWSVRSVGLGSWTDNAAGVNVPSMPSVAITQESRIVTLPLAPSAVSAYPGEHGKVSIHFQSLAMEHSDEAASPITAYVVTVEPDGRKVILTGRNVIALQDGKHVTFKVISGLKSGTYTFRVAAVNEAGEGEAATTSPVVIP